MICCLIRHGKDDETVRGGWSQQPLTDEGIWQAEQLACRMDRFAIQKLYSSDLTRAAQTAQIIADTIGLPVITLAQFREVNNGDLAGMKNTLALERYPGLFWNQLGWEQCYPGGESPKQFYERIVSAWSAFAEKIVSSNENVALVTHGGVIQVILSIISAERYTNTAANRRIGYTQVIPLEYADGSWKEIM